jgi:hypothetical protein
LIIVALFRLSSRSSSFGSLRRTVDRSDALEEELFEFAWPFGGVISVMRARDRTALTHDLMTLGPPAQPAGPQASNAACQA